MLNFSSAQDFISEVVFQLNNLTCKTQKEVCDECGLSQVSLSRLRRGKYVPTLFTFIRLVQAYLKYNDQYFILTINKRFVRFSPLGDFRTFTFPKDF